MQEVVSQLENIVKKNPLGEKILVAPTYSAGRQLLESCTKRGLNTLNLRINTLQGLAEQVCQLELRISKRSLIPTTVANELLIGILKRLAVNGSLAYFGSLEITLGVSRVIYQAILELKLATLNAEELSPSKFITVDKGKDITTIWLEYEKELRSRKYLDQADLFRLAVCLSFPTSPRTYLVPTILQLSSLERNFLRVLTKDNFEAIDFGRPKGITVPQNSLERELAPVEMEVAAGFSRLLWLNDLAKAPVAQALEVEMFRAYGESNELREVLSRIKKRAIPLDQAAIYYSTQEPYAHLCYALAQELTLPITFGQGINIRCTNPGRLYFGLLAWAEGGFKVSDFVPLITNGELKISDENAPSKSAIVRFLRTSAIGWGRERYFAVIENELAQVESELASAAELADGKVDTHQQQRRDQLQWLKNFFSAVFASLPEADLEGYLPYGKLAGWLYDLVDGFASVFNAADGEGKKVICDELYLLRNSFSDNLEPEEAYTRLTAVIEGSRVNSSNPQPGCLHIDHYTAGQWIARPHTFVVGLDANSFPGASTEDPILLDQERENLGHGLRLLCQRTKEKSYALVQFLSSVPETLTTSYSDFNTVENRMVFPAAVLLQLHRLLANDVTLDYSELLKSLGERKGFIPIDSDEIVGEASWWLHTLAKGTRNVELATIKQLYPALYDGLQAENKRNEAELTAYDGKVNVDRAEQDPTVNPELIMSCSQIETLGKCPYSYFLRYVLRLKPVEEITFDPSVWLDAKTKGDLYHLIFERFYRGLLEKGESQLLTRLEDIGIATLDMKSAFSVLSQYPDVVLVSEETSKPELSTAFESLKLLVYQARKALPDQEPEKGWDALQKVILKAERFIRFFNLEQETNIVSLLKLFDKQFEVTQNRWNSKDEAKQYRDEFNAFADLTVGPILQAWREYCHHILMEFLIPAVNYYEQVRFKHSTLNFQDLLLKTRNLLRENPEVRDYFHSKYPRLLVDEFQDTDPIQAEIIFYLTGQDVKERDWHRLLPYPGALFVVGDPKQSIYRFRRADIDTYNLVKKLIKQSGGEVLKLTANFRSVEILGEVLNPIFQRVFPDYETSYQAEFSPIETLRPNGIEAVVGLQMLTIPAEYKNKEEIFAADAERIARYIRWALDGNISLAHPSEQTGAEVMRKAEPKDFMILLRFKDGMDTYARALEKYGIPLSMTGGTSIGASIELAELYKLLRVLANPDDQVLMVGVLRGLFFGFSDDELYQIKKANGHFNLYSPVPEGIGDNLTTKYGHALNKLKEYLYWTRQMLPTVAMTKLITDLGLIPYTLGLSNSQSRTAYFYQVLELLRQTEINGKTRFDQIIAEFGVMLSGTLEDEISLTAKEENAVRLMNLHKAKGLEAPVADELRRGGKLLPEPYHSHFLKVIAGPVQESQFQMFIKTFVSLRLK